MNSSIIETDYLVVGAGTGGLAFVDTLLMETPASVTIVDDRARPGGHWNDAYDFVRLHQPSEFYGVNSTQLGSNAVLTRGSDRGFHEMATGEEVRAYFVHVMDQVLLPSGRVNYLSMSRHEGDGKIRSLLNGSVQHIRPRKKLVDTTYVAGTVPSRHVPCYSISSGVQHISVNGLADMPSAADTYVIIGAGKTGTDACLWLLTHGVDPDSICWIIPRDAWFLDRAHYQPDDMAMTADMAGQMEAAADAATVEDLFGRMEAMGLVLRLDRDVWPTAYRCATVSRAELARLRSIKNVVRLGRVTEIRDGMIQLERGEIRVGSNAVHVDCSAKGIAPKPLRPIWDNGRITVQYVRSCGQPPFSAALIALVEANFDRDEIKNDLCRPVPGADRDCDWVGMNLANALNSIRWARDPILRKWLSTARLNIFRTAPLHGEAFERLREAYPRAIENLTRLAAREIQ